MHHLYLCACFYMCSCTHVHMWRPENNSSCHSFSTPIMFFEAGFAKKTGWLVNLGDPPVSGSQHWDYRNKPPCLGNLTQVLLAVKQVLCQLNCLGSFICHVLRMSNRIIPTFPLRNNGILDSVPTQDSS